MAGRDLLIVGGGIMGLSAAWAAARAGKRVAVLDARPLINEHNASNDDSKIFRFAYGPERAYVKLAKKALDGWRRLEDESGRMLLHTTGLVLFGPPGGFAQQSARTLLEMGEDVRVMKGPYPPFENVSEVVMDPHGGWLDARSCLHALEERAIAAGAVVQRGSTVKTVTAGTVTLEDGERIDAKSVLVTAGFHAPRLVPALRSKIRVTRQPELFFDAPSDYPDSPVFAAFEEGFYGFPNVGGTVKIADHRKGPAVTDPERRPPATDAEIKTARAWLARRIPQLATRPLVRQRICLYDNTSDDHFVLGRADGVVVGAGFSGHGFKFAPAIGEELARLAA